MNDGSPEPTGVLGDDSVSWARDIDEADGGRLVGNLMHFARLLRDAGIPIGPGRVIDGIRAVQAVGVSHRSDFYWALHAVFVHRGDQSELFDQAFIQFWREPGNSQGMAALGASSRFRDPPPPRPGSRRLAEGLSERPRSKSTVAEEALELDQVSYSPREVLHKKDFEQMSVEEIDEARRVLERLDLHVRQRRTRRLRSDPRGRRLDMRGTLRASARGGGAGIRLRWRAPRLQPPPLVALCDISGSMGRYTRMFLRFLHAMANGGAQVQTFLFATRLTHVTGHLKHRDIDEALAMLGKSVEDWSGGTRIGACLRAFNQFWARRVLTQGAVVLLMTDGLDRDAGESVGPEMDRLRRSCQKLIWLNPLLRYEEFEPKALGIQAMLPHVDDFRPVHNLDSLAELVEAVSGATGPVLPT